MAKPVKTDLASPVAAPTRLRDVVEVSPAPAGPKPVIEPYRNGMVATHLTGEALRLALIEDARITKEFNREALAALQQPTD